ncbi:endonuclease-reverse transcriptase [Elysia marginata]|uniref:Endonuclease-reverse transcriptase n=1 Tax=Elysia marginata TaxID=1093978 RepID=A0AAV4IIS9_9GAST|nr:endonuclease-reverse transcriptase [Elysia marginata]
MRRKLGYAGHIMRGSSGPLLQLSLEGKIEGKRGQGRPRRNWMGDVKEWSGSTSCGDTKRKAENRGEWRDMVANIRTGDGTCSCKKEEEEKEEKEVEEEEEGEEEEGKKDGME